MDRNVKFIGKLFGGEVDVYWYKLDYWFSENKKSNIYADELPTFDEWVPKHPIKKRRLF